MTAELLAQALAREGQAVPVEISAALRAEGPTDVALAQLEERCRSQRVAAVGHEPMLSELLRRLLPEAAVATALPQGKLTVRGRRIDPAAIRRTRATRMSMRGCGIRPWHGSRPRSPP